MVKTHYITIFRLTTFAGLTAGLLISCAVKPNNSGPPVQVQPYQQRLETAQAKQPAIRAEYKALSVLELIRRLESDSSKDVEPFNSLAYREAVARGAAIGRELATSIKSQDRSSFLTLLAVRKTYREGYDALDAKSKAAILVSALQNSKYFNAWGLPHLYWEDAAKALIELKDVAAPALTALLQEQRTAPLWGSEEAMESKAYNYRLKDYAWALLLEISGEKVTIPREAGARDQLISTMKK